MFSLSRNDSIRFWAWIDKKGEDECWEWKGCTVGNGYAQFYYKRHRELAHRVAYKLTYGDIPDGLLVCHKCDNRRCANPKHLFTGTNLDNTRDMIQKGRMVYSGNLSKLSAEQVVEIRKEYAEGETSLYKLAKKYGVRQYQTIDAIVSNKSWRDV